VLTRARATATAPAAGRHGTVVRRRMRPAWMERWRGASLASDRGRQRVVLGPVQLDVDDGKGSDGAREQQRLEYGGRSGMSGGWCGDKTR
jgi:hypothetical protein